jgi:hypothetical protein
MLRVLAEIGVVGQGDATREGVQNFRQWLEELGTTYIKRTAGSRCPTSACSAGSTRTPGADDLPTPVRLFILPG